MCDAVVLRSPDGSAARVQHISGGTECSVPGGKPAQEISRVAEVAHDLRMPLALILAHCERLASTLVDRDQLVEIDQIRDTASRMGRQVDGLVQPEPPARAPVDVTALAGDVVARFRPLAHARSREITFDCPASAIVLAQRARTWSSRSRTSSTTRCATRASRRCA